ncbi:integrase catalytic domain-containing protein [Trichonephila clavata]|uniref:Integrase catalytic domain-containing protein n=1 Tax=Trichonephila clavata TaxID=2740835 RepID=A0A8X6LV56_TRICU|nr:integrase catalytic domain-containing protein [Trichonephila clavata]
MCTKAVHLELVSLLSAAAFLSALRRFVSRRGYPSDIYSDNGTNFVGASAYLKDLFKLFTTLMSRTIRQAKTFSGTSFLHIHRISEVCGSLSQTHKASLLKTLKAAVLNFEELATILCQIEACINSRPLICYHQTLRISRC